MDRKHKLRVEMTKAIQEKNEHAVSRLLVEENFDVDSELMLHKYPIMISIESDAVAIGKFLIQHGCSLSLKNIQGLTPLLLAVQLLNFDFVKLLLENRADLTTQDNEGRTALHLAAQMNSLRMLKLLMRNESAAACVLKTLDKEGKTPFMYACAYGSKNIISYFLEKGCDVNGAFGPYQDTPLLTLISNYYCSSHLVDKFLDAGANINQSNKLGENPLLKALHQLEHNKLFHNICSTLITRGAEVNVSNTLGDTPLHIAVIMNDIHLVRNLLNAGSSLNISNNLGLTPLFYACKKGSQEMASLLLDCGASAKVVDYFSNDHYQWLLNNMHMLYPDTCSVLNYVFKKSKECRDLSSSCRLVIRKHLSGCLDQSASRLPLPQSLIKFILLC